MEVFGTTTVLVLFYCPDIPIDRVAFRETIAEATIHMTEQRHVYGDRNLRYADDPYTTSVVEGVNCRLTLESIRLQGHYIPHHLTYQLTIHALVGLFAFGYRNYHAGYTVAQVYDPEVTGTTDPIGVFSIRPLGPALDAKSLTS